MCTKEGERGGGTYMLKSITFLSYDYISGLKFNDLETFFPQLLLSESGKL